MITSAHSNTHSWHSTMPKETRTIPFGSIAEYQRARSGSGHSRKELLEEQDAMEKTIVKKAAARGVKLM